jgi:CheY-like chemotaxis protein
MHIVLAIDDDPTVLKLLESQLYQMKFRVFTEMSARKGIDTAKSLNPDVIILDLNMPELSGFQVMENLAKDPITTDIPIIVLTSLGDRDVVKDAIRYGIVDYIVKPHDHEKLRDKINSAVRYSGLKRDQKASDETDRILVSHSSDTVMISFKSRPASKEFIGDARKVFTPFFLKLVANKNCVIDLRALREFDGADAKVMDVLLKLFGERTVNIVAGRHYGEIVETTEITPNVNLFITFGDMELAVNKQKHEQLKKKDGR